MNKSNNRVARISTQLSRMTMMMVDPVMTRRGWNDVPNTNENFHMTKVPTGCLMYDDPQQQGQPKRLLHTSPRCRTANKRKIPRTRVNQLFPNHRPSGGKEISNCSNTSRPPTDTVQYQRLIPRTRAFPNGSSDNGTSIVC